MIKKTCSHHPPRADADASEMSFKKKKEKIFVVLFLPSSLCFVRLRSRVTTGPDNVYKCVLRALCTAGLKDLLVGGFRSVKHKRFIAKCVPPP